MSMVKVQELTKVFNGLEAVKKISFTIEEGEIFGLLGPNGAGKTTTISILSTLLSPTYGTAWINGHNVITDPDGVRKSIGVVFQDPSLDDELTAYENMDFHGRMYRLPRSERKKKIEEMLTLVDLWNRKDDLVKTFSGGMKRRLELARGLLHSPKVLFLDEPTLGLDPQTRRHIWEYIERLNRDVGITIILTTHYMEEADKLCDRVAIMDADKIIAMDTPENLKNLIRGDLVIVKGNNAGKLKLISETIEWVRFIGAHDGMVTFSVDEAEKRIANLIIMAHEAGVQVDSIQIRRATLEDVFLHFTGRNLRAEKSNGIEKMRMAWRAMRR